MSAAEQAAMQGVTLGRCLGGGLRRNGESSFLKHILTQLCGQGTLTSEFSICLGFLPSCEQLLSEAGEDDPGGK